MKLSEIKPGMWLWTFYVSSRLFDYDDCFVEQVKVLKRQRFCDGQWDIVCVYPNERPSIVQHHTQRDRLFLTKRDAELGLAAYIVKERDELCAMVDKVLKRLKVDE